VLVWVAGVGRDVGRIPRHRRQNTSTAASATRATWLGRRGRDRGIHALYAVFLRHTAHHGRLSRGAAVKCLTLLPSGVSRRQDYGHRYVIALSLDLPRAITTASP